MIRVGICANTIHSDWHTVRWHAKGSAHGIFDSEDFPAAVELGTNIIVDVEFEPRDLPHLRAVVERLEAVEALTG